MLHLLRAVRAWAFRIIVAAICLAIPALLLCSCVVGAIWHPYPWFTGAYWFAPAALIAGLNFYLSFVRPRLYRRTHRSMKGYRWVSGVPVIGDVFLAVGAVLTMGAAGSAALGLVITGLNTGGLPWFLAAVWRDKAMWDR